MFNLLVKLVSDEIEIGFCRIIADRILDSLRQLVDRKLIPDDVVVQILCRVEHLIKLCFEAIRN